jgi:hypothetical protein
LAITFPGKIGDFLYCLSTVRKISEDYNTKIDLYTSWYCMGTKRLVEYQPYINQLIESPNYIIERMDCGVQPWEMPVIGEYDKVFHLGFRKVPDKSIPDFIAEQVGIQNIPYMDISCPDYITLNEPYITINSRNDARYSNVYREFIDKCPYPVVSIGANGEYIGNGIDKTGMDFIDVATWISKSFCFIGSSANFVIAEGFKIKKLVPTDGHDFDKRHLVYDNLHEYILNPTVDVLLQLVEREVKWK